jgi:putative membrane protein
MMEVAEFRSGAVAGLVATAPMTAAMKIMKKQLPWYEQYPLPPKQITMSIGRKMGHYKQHFEPLQSSLSWLSHFGYGAAAGTVYAFVTRPFKKIPGIVKGMIFGLLVWAAGYLGWLPAFGIMRPAHKQPLRRTALMIAAHLIWGGVLGLLVEKLEKKDEG